MKQRIEAAQALLAYLDRNGVPAVICGGYARDTICGKPIKDVDIAVSVRHYNFTATALGNVSADRPDNHLDERDPRYVHASIVRQEEFQLCAGHSFELPTQTINLVGLHEALDVTVETWTGKINFGICKAGIDLNGISVTDDFRADYKDKQITLLRTDWGLEGSMKHFLRLQAKYPWPMRVRENKDAVEL